MNAPIAPSPAQVLVRSWLERQGFPERMDVALFEELCLVMGELVGEVLGEAEEAKAAARAKALGEVKGELETMAKKVAKEAGRAKGSAAGERFRAMAAAHERDARAVGKMLGKGAKKT